MNSDEPSPQPSVVPPKAVAEVRYSLAELLEEIRAERASGGFTLEKLAQTDIAKAFKGKAVRRRPPRDA